MEQERNLGRVPVPAALICVAACGLAFRRFQLGWGSRPEEVGAELPGDDLITNPGLQASRSITIHAPTERVWPWLVQMGQRRGGLYSYDFLENLAGLDIHSADRIHPEWQDIKVGDPVHLAPTDTGDLQVALLEPERALVLRVPPGPATGPFDFTWSFVLRPEPDRTTRLVVRERYAYRQWWARFLVETVEIASFVMSVRMLHGIRRRAEGNLAGNKAGSAAVLLSSPLA
ncbi:SRPBCC family protein [Arthrobacter sp. SLBN-100]|uniref:SRPBCC family protein n=1 Tax=Arthrobacter sp. SLBN-100 TaxID=2768450 RepID=UPI00190F9EFB|nr:SRPBCC family protein [Arthrobacter sp. SLBN-100]